MEDISVHFRSSVSSFAGKEIEMCTKHVSLPVVFGWLWKQGSSFKTWKKRFFVLKDTNLSYYDMCTIMTQEDGSLRYLDGAPKGCLEVGSVEESSRSAFGLCISCSGGKRKLYVQADSENAKRQWMHTLENCGKSEVIREMIDSSCSSTSSCASSLEDAQVHAMPDVNATSVSPLQFKCEKAGWLMKRGGNFRSWKKRFFILKDKEVSYHLVAAFNSPPIRSGKVVKVEVWDGKPFGWIVTLANGRAIYLTSHSDKDRQEWITAIAACVG